MFYNSFLPPHICFFVGSHFLVRCPSYLFVFSCGMFIFHLIVIDHLRPVNICIKLASKHPCGFWHLHRWRRTQNCSSRNGVIGVVVVAIVGVFIAILSHGYNFSEGSKNKVVYIAYRLPLLTQIKLYIYGFIHTIHTHIHIYTHLLSSTPLCHSIINWHWQKVSEKQNWSLVLFLEIYSWEKSGKKSLYKKSEYEKQHKIYPHRQCIIITTRYKAVSSLFLWICQNSVCVRLLMYIHSQVVLLLSLLCRYVRVCESIYTGVCVCQNASN